MRPHLVSCRCPPATDRWCACIFLSFFHHQEWVQLTGTQWVSVSTVLSIMRSSLNAADRSSLTMTLSNRWLYWFSITSEVLSISWRSSSCHRRKKRDKRRNRQNQGKRFNTGCKLHGLQHMLVWWSESNREAVLRCSLTLNGLADALSSLPDMNLAFCLVSLNLSITGGFTNTTNGLNSAVRRCFIIWTEEKQQTH